MTSNTGYITSTRAAIAVAIALSVLLGGCAQLGPQAIKATRLDYNIAVQKTTDEQLLVNLVRMRYRDTPLFIDVSAIASQLNITGGASASGNLLPNIADSYEIGGSVEFSETPTISYSPLQGEDFVKRLLAPVRVDQLILLSNSGWSLSRILRVCVQHINGIANAPRASGPTPDTPPEFADFIRLADRIRELQLENALEIGYQTGGEQPVAVIRFKPSARTTAPMSDVVSLLDLEPGQETFVLNEDPLGTNRDVIRLRTRSLLGILYYLSQSVAIPEADAAAGKVTVTRHSDGSPFDWADVTRGLFHVSTATNRPDSAAVAVRYRGHWFYIDDTDLDSKSTFAFLSQLFALQAGSAESVTPVLTLPVGN